MLPIFLDPILHKNHRTFHDITYENLPLRVFQAGFLTNRLKCGGFMSIF